MAPQVDRQPGLRGHFKRSGSRIMKCLIELVRGPADGMLIDLVDEVEWPERFKYVMAVDEPGTGAGEPAANLRFRGYVYRMTTRPGARGRRLYEWDGIPPTPLTS
ncbi:hypothetical protein [Singulisphaera sp. PoT]|uniref:hypothetical protein n=1 Tax=Singulisphaera sp. PoT TaxID=3411797 RepID=UPI003BF61698